jgi:hypothetical protein
MPSSCAVPCCFACRAVPSSRAVPYWLLTATTHSTPRIVLLKHHISSSQAASQPVAGSGFMRPLHFLHFNIILELLCLLQAMPAQFSTLL